MKNAAEAREIISQWKAYQKNGDLLPNQTYEKHIEAKGYLEGYNSKEALERPEVKALVEALEKIHWFINLGIDREGSSESKVRILTLVEGTLAGYREAVKK